MSLKLNQPAPAAQANTASGEKRPAAKLWANIGVDAQITKDDGTVVTEFVALGLGVPLDYLEPVQTTARSSAEWKQIADIRNWLMNELQSNAAALPAGERDYVDGIRVMIAHASEKSAAPTTNVVETAGVSLSFGRSKGEAA